MDVDLIRHVFAGVLSALEFLHRNNVVHKQVADSCIHIKEDGKSFCCQNPFATNSKVSGTVKLSNYSICTRLADLATSTSINSYSKKIDVFKFGLFALYLGTGTVALVETVKIPTSLPSDLRDFLAK